MNNEEKKLMNFWDLLGMSVGQIIGSGIMVLTGVAIGFTGKGTPWAFIVGGIITILPLLCVAQLGSAIPANGGMYTYVRDLIGPKTGFFYLSLLVAGQLVIAIYALGFAEYLGSLVNINGQLVAAIVMTACFVINLNGVKSAAVVQNLIVIFLLIALATFALFGLPHVTDFGAFFRIKDVMPKGFSGFITASILLRYAMVGAEFTSEFGDDAENPGKNIPKAMVLSVVVVAFFYFLIGVVASGTLPIDQVAFQPLANVALEILPKPLYIFFIIGGAMFALFSSLNAVFAWGTKGLGVAIDDGWLPAFFGKENKKGSKPWLLGIYYVVGMIPIVTKMDLTYVSMLGNGVGMIFGIIPVISLLFLLTKKPEAYENAQFKLPKLVIRTLPIISLLVFSGAIYVSLGDLNTLGWILLATYIIATLLYGYFREKQIKKI